MPKAPICDCWEAALRYTMFNAALEKFITDAVAAGYDRQDIIDFAESVSTKKGFVISATNQDVLNAMAGD